MTQSNNGYVKTLKKDKPLKADKTFESKPRNKWVRTDTKRKEEII